jgi:hypothetical protein
MRKFIFFALATLLLLPWLCDTSYQEMTSIEASVPPTVTDAGTFGSAISSEGAGSTSQAIELKNPTFQELKDFILRDPTNLNKFVLNQYECRHYATEVDNNAEAEGLRCAFVLLCYDRGQHAVVAFDTTDRGLVYIEPQTDARIYPEVGGEYQEREIIEILIAW